jgi:hypothetical protein
MALVREVWWLVVLVPIVSVCFGVYLDPTLGFAVPVITVPMLLYFAYVRYDEHGRPRG